MRVREIRNALGLKQIQLAKILGVHSITVSNWERGVLGYAPTQYQEDLLVVCHVASMHEGFPEELSEAFESGGAIYALGLILKTGLDFED